MIRLCSAVICGLSQSHVPRGDLPFVTRAAVSPSHAGALRGPMLPNVRLLFAALLVSVVALSCGFGVFAALGVSREPLGRLPASTTTTALQLVDNEAAAKPATWGAPFGPGFHPSVAQIGAVATDASIVTPARGETSAPSKDPNPWTAGTFKAEATATSPTPVVQPIPISAVTAMPSSPTLPAASAAPSAAEQPAPTPVVSVPPALPAAATVSPAPAAPLASTASAAAQETPSANVQGDRPAPDVITKAAEDKPAAAAVSTAPATPLASTASAAAEETGPADVQGNKPAPDVVTKATEGKPAPATVSSAPATPPASMASTAAQETPSGNVQGDRPAPDAVTKAAEDKPAPAAAPVVAVVEPTATAAPPAASPLDVTGTVPDAATVGAKMPEELTPMPEPREPRKIVRRPIERRLVRRRPAQPTNAPTSAWSYNNTSPYQARVVFRSAPRAFGNASITGRRTVRRTATTATTATATTPTPAYPSAWSSAR